MLYLGTKASVVYLSKNGRAGLTDITATIVKPNGQTLLASPASEAGSGVLSGFYTFDFTPLESDPEGDWKIFFNSPTEEHKAVAVRSFVARPESGGGSETFVVNTPDRIIVKVKESKVGVKLKDPNGLKVIVSDEEAVVKKSEDRSTQKIQSNSNIVRT